MGGIGTIKALVRRGLGVSSRSNDGFNLDFSDTVVSEEALRVAREIRGERPPTLIIHGVMQRSGTHYTGQLLRLHPNLYAYPNKVWEVPFLQLTKDILHTQITSFRSTFRIPIRSVTRISFRCLARLSSPIYIPLCPPENGCCSRYLMFSTSNIFSRCFPMKRPCCCSAMGGIS